MDLWSRLLGLSIISYRLSTASCRAVPYVGSWEPVPSRHGQCPLMKSRYEVAIQIDWRMVSSPLTKKPQKEQNMSHSLSHGRGRRTSKVRPVGISLLS